MTFPFSTTKNLQNAIKRIFFGFYFAENQEFLEKCFKTMILSRIDA